jgi:lipopolysaccharide exporter
LATISAAPTITGNIERSDIGRRYVEAAVHSGVGGVISRILQGFTPIILARYLGPKEYGVYALVLSLVGVVAGVSHLGQNTALQKFLPEYSIKNPSRGGAILADTIILVSGALAVFCTTFFLAAGWIASAIYHEPSLTRVFQFSALLVLALSLFNLASSATAGLQDFRAYSRAMVVRSTAYLGLGWLGVWLLGLYGALLGQLLASALGLILLTTTALRLGCRQFPSAVRPQFSGEILKEIFSFAFPALLAGLLVSPAYWWANTLLARQAGFEEVGLFGVAFALAQMIMFVPSNLSVPAVSFMSEAHTAAGHVQFNKLVTANLRLMWAMTLPICLVCAVSSETLVRSLFGTHFTGSTRIVPWMVFTALCIVVNSQISAAISSLGRMWHALGLNALWLTLFCPLVWHLAPHYGALGLAIAFFISYVLFTLVVCAYSRLSIRVTYEKLAPMILITFAAIALGVAIPSLHVGGTVSTVLSLVSVVSLVCVEWRWFLEQSERDWMRGTLRWVQSKS